MEVASLYGLYMNNWIFFQQYFCFKVFIFFNQDDCDMGLRSEVTLNSVLYKWIPRLKNYVSIYLDTDMGMII